MSENELNKCKDETPAITVTDILEQVKESICDNYCKFPERYNENEDWDRLYREICDACPLNRL